MAFFLSGTTGLAYQVVWSEQLVLVLGATHSAVAAVLAAFMAGLALGAAVAGRLAGAVRRPLLTYALLELIIAVSALAIPTLLKWATFFETEWLSAPGTATGGGDFAFLFFLGVAFAVLLIPTTAMGATLPLLASSEIARSAQLGSRLGLLYGINTLGAAFGAAASSFYLVPWLGVEGTVRIAVLMNLAILVLAWRIAAVGDGESREEGGGSAEPEPPADTDSAPRGRAWLLLPLMFFSGAVAFGYEVLWTRLLAHLLGSSIFAFGTMLATFLGGLALGSLLISLPGLRRLNPLIVLIWAQVAAAGLGWVVWSMAERLPWLANRVGGTWGSVLVAALTLLPITTVIGSTWPLAVRAYAIQARLNAARAAGEISAWNTAGAICGALGGGLILLPAWGFAGSVRVAVATSLALALLATFLLPFHRTLRYVGLLLALPAAFLLPMEDPLALLRLEPQAPGKTRQVETADKDHQPGEVIYNAVGRSSDVVLLDLGMAYRLTTNGLPESLMFKKGARSAQLPVARWMVGLPALLRPESKEALVIGYGGGALLEDIPAGWSQIEVVEIEERVLEANQQIALQRRRDPLADSRVRVVVDDARSLLRRSQRTWDVIVSQPSHPWTAASSHLFTREFFDLVATRLSDDGIFVAWMGNAYVDRELTRILLRTLAESFPQTALYQPTGAGALLLVGSRSRLDIPPNTWSAAQADDREFWSRLGITHVDHFRLGLRLDDAGLRAITNEAPAITDSRNLLKTRSPRVHEGLSLEALDELTLPFDPLPRQVSSGLVATRRLLEFGRRARAEQLVASLPKGEERSLAEALLLANAGKKGQALQTLQTLSPTYRTRREQLALLLSDAQQGQELGLYASLSEEELAIARFSRAEAEDLDGKLAAIEPGGALVADALRLRIQWRLKKGNRGALEQALALTESLLASSPRVEDFFLRLEAARGLDDRWVELAVLDELIVGIRSGRVPAKSTARVEEALADLAQRQKDQPVAGLPLDLVAKTWREAD